MCTFFFYLFLTFLSDFIIVTINLIQLLAAILIRINYLRIYLSIYLYIITQVILAFWFVLAYDLLEDRHTIDVIITELSPLPF